MAMVGVEDSILNCMMSVSYFLKCFFQFLFFPAVI